VNKKQRKRREKQSRHKTQPTVNNGLMFGEEEGAHINSTEKSDKKENGSRKPQNPSRIARWVKWIDANDGVVIAAFTACLVVIGALQYCNYRSQLEVAKADERPWIKITADPSQPDISVNSPEFKEAFQVVNTGKSPAKNIDAQFFIEKVNKSDSPQFNGIRCWRFSTGILFPNVPAFATFSDSATLLTLSPAEVTEFQHGDIYFVVYTTTTYKDAFGDPHWAKFCVAAMPKAPPYYAYNAKACTDYNDAD